MLKINGRSAFQFGDLRVETKNYHVIVEVESAGGVTNLTKYWFAIISPELSGQILKTIKLFHVFRQHSKNDYYSHIALWDFLWDEMRNQISKKIEASIYPYHNNYGLQSIINKFEMLLKKEI